MEDTFNHMDELIGKYLAGEATSAEREEVDAWLKRSEENQKYIEQLKTIFERTATIRDWQEFDADAAWGKLKTRLKAPGAKTVSLNDKQNLSFYWRVAAVVALFLMAGYATYQLISRDPVQTMALESKKVPVLDTLPDGSTAYLNKRSALNFVYDPGTKNRTVRLEGEAYFDVKHEEDKPFIIQNEEIIIEDIGTAFNVKAYPENQTVEVFVESGEVAFYTKSNDGLRLSAGETGVYDKLSKSFTRISQADPNILAYKTLTFNFYNSDLGTVVERLNEVYETKIQLRGTLKSCRLNVTFKNEPIESIAEIIAETLNLKMTVSEKEILLEGPGCE